MFYTIGCFIYFILCTTYLIFMSWPLLVLPHALCCGHCCFMYCILCTDACFLPLCAMDTAASFIAYCCFITCMYAVYRHILCAVGSATLCHGYCCFIYCLYAVYCHICCAVGTVTLCQKHYVVSSNFVLCTTCLVPVATTAAYYCIEV